MRLRFNPGAGLDAEFQRLGRYHVDRALALLGARDLATAKILHETRRGFKRLRGLLRLVRDADEDFYRAENARYRDCARTLARGREASALVETVDRLLKPGLDPAEAAVLAAFRQRLDDRRAAIEADREEVKAAIAGAVLGCEAGRDALARFRAPASPREQAAVIASGVARIVRSARRSLGRAARSGEAEAFHELRKAVKYHALHLDLLADVWEAADARRRSAAKRLGDVLGEFNDIAVMKEFLRQEPELADDAAPAMRRLMKRRDRQLRATALRAGQKLFHEGGGATARAVARGCRDASRRRARPDPAPAAG